MVALKSWPALQGMDTPLSPLQYGRAVWGKVHGANSDFRWIARSQGFKADDGMARELLLGNEDTPPVKKMYFWRPSSNVGKTSAYLAGTAYLSRAVDAAGRRGFLEKQLLELDADCPAAAMALLGLPTMAAWSDDIWWSQSQSLDWSRHGTVLPISGKQILPTADLAQAVETGLNALDALDPEALRHLYACLLAGERPACLRLSEPLPPEALAALLLPLHRSVADKLSLVGWVPSQRYERDDLGKRWDIIILPDSANLPTLSDQALEKMEHARLCVQALRDRNPALLQQEKPLMSDDSVLPLAIWGPSASGKTVLMAQLHLETHAVQGDWDVYPSHQDSLQFIHQMQEYRLNNEFPPATTVGLTEQIAYEFFNRKTGARASLAVEDRGGKDYEHETLHGDARNRINAAAGLVLLIDPSRDLRHIQSQLSHLLRQMHTDRRTKQPQLFDPKDPRPIAVCISKADYLIEWPADYRYACQDPDAFVRENDHWDLTGLLDKFCANYRFFPVSAVGVNLRHGVIEANTFYDENLNLRIKTKGKPFNLMNPFAWLIGQLTANL